MIREVIYQFWQDGIPSLRPRDFDFELIDLDLINDILGTRRAGKTYLLFFIIKYLWGERKIDKKATIYINLENRKLFPLREDYFNQIIEFVYSEELLNKFKKIYIFLDEIQNIENWERWIRSIYDEFKGKIKIFISGSNEKLLGKEYSKLLTGRHITFYLFPLSFKEFLNFNSISFNQKEILEKEKSIIKKKFREYLKFGGFPEVVLSSKKEQILQQYFSDIISRDVIFKEKIRKDLSLIEDLGIYFINNVCNLTSFRRLTDFFNSRGVKISLPGLQHYYKLFEEAFLFFSTRIFSYKIKDQLQHPIKIYCIDTGLINALSFKFSKDKGKLYENIVAIELKRRGKEIYYWKDAEHREVDFVIKEGLKITQLIQVCFEVEEEKTKKREIDALVRASKELKCKNLIIITDDFEGKEIVEKREIFYLPLWRWLLGDYS